MGASNVVAVAVAAASTDITINDAQVANLYGYSLTAAAACTVFIRSGSTAGPILAVVTFTAGDLTESQWFGPQGIRAPGGIYLDRDAVNNVSGAILVG